MVANSGEGEGIEGRPFCGQWRSRQQARTDSLQDERPKSWQTGVIWPCRTVCKSSRADGHSLGMCCVGSRDSRCYSCNNASSWLRPLVLALADRYVPPSIRKLNRSGLEDAAEKTRNLAFERFYVAPSLLSSSTSGSSVGSIIESLTLAMLR